MPLSVQDEAPADDRIDDLRRWIADHLAEDLSAEVLAERLHLSVRHCTRVFRQRTGTTPAAYVEAARRLLEESDHSLPETVAVSGLGSVDTLHRSFQRRLGTTPAEYRRRFR